MELNIWVKRIYGLAIEKGWHESTHAEIKATGHISVERKLAWHMMVVTEVAEATEEVRNNRPALYWQTPTGIVSQSDVGGGFNLSSGEELQKPEGEMSELADVVIRVMDIFGARGWDLEKIIEAKHEYNISRSFRHGGKSI